MSGASIIVPTSGRREYLEATLASIAPQAADHGAEVIVVDDGSDPATREAADRHRARYVRNEHGKGLNRARNTGVDAAAGDLLVLVDDDVEAQPGWLAALLAAPGEAGVLAARIVARLEGRAPRSCGREGPPITSLDLGDEDLDVDRAYGSCMAIRRAAIERFGKFDEAWPTGAGDEEEWVRRFVAGGGRVRYVASAVIVHRRAGRDARLRALTGAAYRRGVSARRFDVAQGVAPGVLREAAVVVRCLIHVVRFACPAMLVGAASALGRTRAALLRPPAPRPVAPAGAGPTAAPGDDFLAGTSGAVGGLRGRARVVADRALDVAATAGGRRRRLLRDARAGSTRRVLAIGAYRLAMDETVAELRRSRHEVTIDVRAAGAAGKFENLNAILTDHDLSPYDWLIAVDDDVVLPRGFLDGFVFVAERFGFVLAQPAQSLASHAAWPVVRRRPRSVARRTTFVEIGPVTAFRREAFSTLLPFPELRMAWGLDLHWAAVAEANGWPIGVIDALVVRHESRQVAASYSRDAAIDEARGFLAGRPYLRRDQVRTLTSHKRW